MDQRLGRARLHRCLLVLAVVTAGALGLGDLLLPDLQALGRSIRAGGLQDEPFDVVLVQLCEAAITGCAAWLWLCTAAVSAEAARGRRTWRRGVPGILRQVVLAACGAALVGGLAGPAHAEDDTRASLDGLPLPDRATTAQVSRVFARAAQQDRARHHWRPRTAVVVVAPGDTLWAIARASLPPHASDAAVTDRVRQIHRANRSVIGADPDLIRPCQRLRVPDHTTIQEEQR